MEWVIKLRLLKIRTQETYKSISEKTGIPQTTIEKIFNGRTKDPKLHIIQAIVHCLGYTIDDLLSEDNSALEKQPMMIAQNEKSLISNYRALSDQGKFKAEEYISDLAENPKYKKTE